ncbi:MAG TPA: hypothetical protein ENK00_01825 [Chromatiales bacterium]|nr:hypothetical protein [Chromatiales bacterium]
MAEQFDTIYFSGQGPLFIGDRDANGNPAGLIFVGDLSEASLTPNVETAEVVENVSGQGAIGNSFTKKVEYQLSITMRSVKPEHLALALQGVNTAKAGGSVTDEPHKGYLGKMVPLVHNKVSTVVVTDSAGTTTYATPADYIVHADEGLVEIVSGGAITEGQDLLIDYAYAAQDHVKVAPANTEKYLVFSGMNRANNNKQTRCEIYKVKLDPGVLGLIQEEQAEMQITGRVLLDSLRPAGDQLYSWKIEQ